MIHILFPYFILYRYHSRQIIFGIFYSTLTLLANISLLALSGWFLAGTALAGAASGLYNFNYMLPAAGVRITSIIRTTSRWADRVTNHDTTLRILQQLRMFIFSRILPLSPGGMLSFRYAELLNNLVTDINTLDNLYLRIFLPLLSSVIVILTVSSSLFLLDEKLGLIIGSIMLITLILIPILFYIIGKPVGKNLTTVQTDYRIQLNTWLTGNAELTVYGAIKMYRQKLDNTEKNWQQYQYLKNNLIISAQLLLMVIKGLTLTLVLWITAEKIGNNSQPGELIALCLFSVMAAFESLVPVASAIQYLSQIISSAAHLNSIINQPLIVQFPIEGPVLVQEVSLKINKISFCYYNQKKPVLNNLSLTVSAGEHIAIIGHTGSGKTTLLQLLTRAWDPQNGEIKLNNIPLPQWSEKTLRHMMVVVPQYVHIFNATLRDNLNLANTSIINDERYYEVMQQVGLETLLDNKGLDVWLGEGGRLLSGGEQRRIGIARALLKAAPLWILDEPTEGLDPITENRILHILTKLDKRYTVIIITHRLKGLEQLDRIHIMERGTILEEGSHQELITKIGTYYHHYYHLRKIINSNIIV